MSTQKQKGQKWSIEEMKALSDGVEMYGHGSWKRILSDPQFASTLANRSNIDLKDKWRNMNMNVSGNGFSAGPSIKSPEPLTAVVPFEFGAKPRPYRSSQNREASIDYKPLIFEAISSIKDPNEPHLLNQQETHNDLKINEEPLISTKEPNVLSQECSLSRSSTQSKKRKRKRNTDIHNIMAVVAKDISNIANIMMEKHKEDDMSACIDKLEKLGWEPNDPMYETALLLFGESADFRKLWLVLKTTSCESWIRNAGKKYGLLTCVDLIR